MSGPCSCGALDCPSCYPAPRPRTEDECPRGSWWWPGEELQQRRREYIEAVTPIALARADLAMKFSSLTYIPTTGEVRRSLPEEINAIDEKYVETTQQLQRHFFGKFRDRQKGSDE